MEGNCNHPCCYDHLVCKNRKLTIITCALPSPELNDRVLRIYMLLNTACVVTHMPPSTCHSICNSRQQPPLLPLGTLLFARICVTGDPPRLHTVTRVACHCCANVTAYIQHHMLPNMFKRIALVCLCCTRIHMPRVGATFPHKCPMLINPKQAPHTYAIATLPLRLRMHWLLHGHTHNGLTSCVYIYIYMYICVCSHTCVYTYTYMH